MIYGFNNRGHLVKRNKEKYKLEIIFGKDNNECQDFIKYEIGMIIKNIEFNKETIIIFSNDLNKYILDKKYNKFVNFFIFNSFTKKSGFYKMLDYFDKSLGKTWIFIDDINEFDDIARAIIPHLTKNNYLTISTSTLNPFLAKAYELVLKFNKFQIILLNNKMTNDDLRDIKKLSEKIPKDELDLFEVVVKIRKNNKGYPLYIIAKDIEKEGDISEKNVLPLHQLDLKSTEYWKTKKLPKDNKIRYV